MDYLKNLSSRESYILNVGYAPPDGGIGDFCFAHNDDGLHLFYIYRKFFEPKDCHAPNQETMLGHAVSKDLIHWEECEPALVKRSKKWDSAHLWAPSVVETNGSWYMLYTGMDDSINQKIGVATSDNWLWCKEFNHDRIE
jgi:sucrose-6-phosphate hydrolase SacC (GH32 family)